MIGGNDHIGFLLALFTGLLWGGGGGGGEIGPGIH